MLKRRWYNRLELARIGFVFATLLGGVAVAVAQSDEILYVVPGSTLSWGAIAPERAQSRSLGTLGVMGNHIAIGDWLGAGRRQPAVAALDVKTNTISWRLALESGEVQEVVFGENGDTVVAAADFDGNGIDDPTVIKTVGRELVWTVSYDLFRKRTYRVSYTFGYRGEYPFFLPREGSRTSLATLVVERTGTRVRLFDTATKSTEVIRGLPRLASGSVPIPTPFTDAHGEVLVAVSRKRTDSTLLMLLNLSRRTISKTVLKADGDLVVGDFLADAGDEYAISTATGVLVGNPFSRRQIALARPQGAILLDAVNINRLASDTTVPVSTPAPAATNSPAPGASPTPTLAAPRNDPPPFSLSVVCAQTSPINPGEMLIKSDPSDHIHSGDARTTGYTVVCGRLCPQKLSYAPFYYSDGTQAGAVAKYGTFRGNGKPRLYGAVGKAPQHLSSEIARQAAGIGNGKLYIQMSDSSQGPMTWCKEFNPTGRNGSL